MAVGSAAVAEVSRARPEAGALRSRKASAAPDPKSKKLGGGARASPPHKNLSGFDIQMHYTRSEPAVDQLGEEFHGSLRGGVGAGDGEHSPHVVCQGAEPCRRLASDPYRRRGNPSLARELVYAEKPVPRFDDLQLRVVFLDFKPFVMPVVRYLGMRDMAERERGSMAIDRELVAPSLVEQLE